MEGRDLWFFRQRYAVADYFAFIQSACLAQKPVTVRTTHLGLTWAQAAASWLGRPGTRMVWPDIVAL